MMLRRVFRSSSICQKPFRYLFCTFNNMVQMFKRVEAVSSTIAKTQIIQAYKASLEGQEAESFNQIIYYLDRKPSLGITTTTILKRYKDAQPDLDLSYITEENLPQFLSTSAESSSATIQNILGFLKYLEEFKGPKSVIQKSNKVFELLKGFSIAEGEYLLKLINRNLRIGVQKKMFEKVMSNQQKDVFTDLNKEEGLKSFGFKAMLCCTLKEDIDLDKFCTKINSDILLDVKYDGERTIITYQKDKEIQMMSRNGKSQISMFFDLSQAIQNELRQNANIESITIDGEIVTVCADNLKPLSTQVLRKRRKSQETNLLESNVDDSVKDMIYGFDVLELNGVDIKKAPLVERRKMIPSGTVIQSSEYKIIKYPEERAAIFDYFEDVIARKYEGLILKGVNDVYLENGTRKLWAKLKKGYQMSKESSVAIYDFDLIVMGAIYGTGKKVNQLSSYLVGTKFEGKIYALSKVGTGFTDEELSKIRQQVYTRKLNLKENQIPADYVVPKHLKIDMYLKPELIFEVTFQEFTKSPMYPLCYDDESGGISFRFPSFRRVRNDKGVDDATSGQYILELANKDLEINQKQLKSNAEEIPKQKVIDEVTQIVEDVKQKIILEASNTDVSVDSVKN